MSFYLVSYDLNCHNCLAFACKLWMLAGLFLTSLKVGFPSKRNLIASISLSTRKREKARYFNGLLTPSREDQHFYCHLNSSFFRRFRETFSFSYFSKLVMPEKGCHHVQSVRMPFWLLTPKIRSFMMNSRCQRRINK